MYMACSASTRKNMAFFRYLIWVFFAVFTVQGCVSIPISYYDATTYTQLTSLKAEITTLVESFDTKKTADNELKIEKTSLDFRKAYEYEKGKGEPNNDTTKQFEKIRSLYEQDVNDYKNTKHGELGPKYFSESAVVLGQAFDIAIATENIKNKDKR